MPVHDRLAGDGTITATGPTVRTHPTEVLTFHVRVRNTGAGSASQRAHRRRDPREHDLRGGLDGLQPATRGAYTPLTDAGDLDQGTGARGGRGRDRHHSGRRDGHRDVGGGARVRDRPDRPDRGRHSPRVQRLLRHHATPTATTFTYAVPTGTATRPAGGAAITATRPRFVLATLGSGEDIDFRFQVTVNAGTAGLFVNNQATVSATESPTTTDTNLVSIPIVGTVTVTGHVLLDLDGNESRASASPTSPT